MLSYLFSSYLQSRNISYKLDSWIVIGIGIDPELICLFINMTTFVCVCMSARGSATWQQRRRRVISPECRIEQRTIERMNEWKQLGAAYRVYWYHYRLSFDLVSFIAPRGWYRCFGTDMPTMFALEFYQFPCYCCKMSFSLSNCSIKFVVKKCLFEIQPSKCLKWNCV